MTKSTITRERLLEIIVTGPEASGAEQNELARMALAAMDSEPVAWTWNYREQWHVTNDERRAEFVAKDGDVAVLPLYRHAQQSVVPQDVLAALQKVARIRLDMNDFDGDRRGIADCLCDAEEALIEVVNRRAVMLQELQKSAGADVIFRSNENAQVLNTIKAPPALDSLPKTGEVQNTNPPENPGCWCRRCRPVVLNDMRFVVCPDCGNKRCPRANDHRNSCTGSNEPGQEGSAYPDTTQEPKP
ncbi:hypothetical protein AAHW99_07280 [Klebsiella variicola subsp. variicola]|uniref:hypothetical protein n=1 Tax=Klebsiella variicola TaxID=244366 RepID=UPI0035ABB801